MSLPAPKGAPAHICRRQICLPTPEGALINTLSKSDFPNKFYKFKSLALIISLISVIILSALSLISPKSYINNIFLNSSIDTLPLLSVSTYLCIYYVSLKVILGSITISNL